MDIFNVFFLNLQCGISKARIFFYFYFLHNRVFVDFKDTLFEIWKKKKNHLNFSDHRMWGWSAKTSATPLICRVDLVGLAGWQGRCPPPQHHHHSVSFQKLLTWSGRMWPRPYPDQISSVGQPDAPLEDLKPEESRQEAVTQWEEDSMNWSLPDSRAFPGEEENGLPLGRADSCPHWVKRETLPLLKVERQNLLLNSVFLKPLPSFCFKCPSTLKQSSCLVDRLLRILVFYQTGTDPVISKLVMTGMNTNVTRKKVMDQWTTLYS